VHEIINLLPEHPPYYDPEELTDRPMRFFVSEIIREKILMQYGQEIPYACEVTIESYKEGETLDRIQAVIYVSRESQKAIIIGKGGLKLKRVGTDARKDIEKLADKQVFLDLRVKVRDNWRNNPSLIKRFGY
jgi:GTP-binding protein Era